MPVSKTELRREVAALSQRLASTRLNKNKKKKRSKSGNAMVPAAMCSSARPVQAQGRRRRATPGSGIGNGGRIVMRRDELLATVATTAGKTESYFSKLLKPGADVMPFLFKLSSCYQRVKWRAMSITWRPAVGTSTNGIITYGIAYNNQVITDRNGVTSLTPVNDHPVWQGSSSSPLTIPGEMLMTRKWYELNTSSKDAFDQAVGTFCCGFTHDSENQAKSRGEFWIRYTVEMEGTNNS